MSWPDTILHTLKDNDVRLVAYVPDNVLMPLLKGVNSDNYLSSRPTPVEQSEGRGRAGTHSAPQTVKDRSRIAPFGASGMTAEYAG